MKHESKPLRCTRAPSHSSAVLLGSDRALPPRWGVKSENWSSQTRRWQPRQASAALRGAKGRTASTNRVWSFRRVRRLRSLSMGSVSRSLAICGVLGGFLLAAEGCSNSLTPSQRVEKELSQVGRNKQKVFSFAGKVLVDGQPPPSKTSRETVVVMLFDRGRPDLPVTGRPYATCNRQGEFSFTTYTPKDGVEPAEYVVVIAQLSLQEKAHNFVGPDGLQNLYNDPDKNDKEPEFTVNHASPGKSDYEFDLKLAGREPVSDAGPRAVTQILFRKPE